jgi:hypothetical protein
MAVIGASAWIVSDLLELLGGGFSVTSMWVTLVAFLLMAIGVWGLHKTQAPDKNMLSLAGASLMSGSLLLFSVQAAQFIGSPETSAVGQGAQDPLFVFGALAMTVGIILFGAAVIRIGHYPAWTGIAMIVLITLTLGVEALGLGLLYQNMVNVGISTTLIFMGVRSLRVLNVRDAQL